MTRDIYYHNLPCAVTICEHSYSLLCDKAEILLMGLKDIVTSKSRCVGVGVDMSKAA